MEKRTICITILLLLITISNYAQQYTQPIYATRKDSAVVFGDETPLNYCGNPFTLKMNIYKPVGDGNTQRPVVICVHGGAFTSGVDFNEASMNVMAREFAKRGYVAVSINYREGHHLYPYGTGNPQFKDAGAGIAFQLLTGSTDWTIQARLYVADSAEVIRSIYRAQQDVKAAIRKMKQRRFTDSTSPCKVFLAGHSAGGISVLAAALTDLGSEKPAVANAMPAAANPQWRDRCEWQITNPFPPFNQICLATQLNGPQNKDNAAYITHNPAPFNYNAASCYLRPDLGTVDGNVNLSAAANTKIMGVASLCGAVVDTNIFSGNYFPPIFMYHQPADRVVPYNIGFPFSYLNDFFAPGPNSKWPLFYGSGWIKNKLNRMNYPAANVLWTYDNSINDPLGTTTHDIIPSIAFVTDSIARFFSRVMDTSTLCVNTVLAVPVSFTTKKDGETALLSWKLFNSAGAEGFTVQHSTDGLNFTDVGNVAYVPQTSEYSFRHSKPAPGMNYYRLKIQERNANVSYSEISTQQFGNRAGVQFYPNPVSDKLTIVLPAQLAGKPVQVKAINAAGKLMMSMASSKSNTLQVDCSAFPQGIYFVTVSTENEAPVTERVVKL